MLKYDNNNKTYYDVLFKPIEYKAQQIGKLLKSSKSEHIWKF